MGAPSQKSKFSSDSESGKGKTGLQKNDSDEDINTLNNLVGIGNKDPYSKANNENMGYPPVVDTPNTNASVQRYTREAQPVASNYSVLPIGRMRTVAEENNESHGGYDAGVTY